MSEGHVDMQAKQAKVMGALGKQASVIVALSGGTDSAYLAWAAQKALGERALAVTALSGSFSAHDREQVEKFVAEAGVRHEFIGTREFENPLYVANNADRCYHCKDALFAELGRMAEERGVAAVAYGINADDTQDFRPGHRAAAEHRVLAPLLDAGLRKAEIRELAREAGIGVWDRPASACLASRIPYGTAVTLGALAMVERGEAELRAMGFRQFRVRYYGETARIEIAREELGRAMESAVAGEIEARVKRAGFQKVELDREGYRQGAMNEVLRGNGV